ncbi:hypothetical protein [Halomonas huangheensis]|uniref:Peptidase C-terminal archaeal/bacterial domain-containing protein n=1 Tax=Halomonas huangheensis TaxID=1178482 RepID=W1N872_9GAMM|nr:hypothetical protein [Halomonas huangheensis]ALM51121.1 hypothetical protein AR456_01535 [Halomonas huangheensis]ERL51120.1 hypothetical protein BJB45_14545 [Halomonas huangheensis]
MINKGQPHQLVRPLALAVRRVALVGGVLATTLLVGCQDQGDSETEKTTGGFDIDAPEVAVGEPLTGELSSSSQINLKDGSRRDQHWLCPAAGNAAEGTLYRLNSPFEGTVTVFDKSGDWLGGAESTEELPAELLVAPVEECSLVVVSGKDMAEFGPYKLEPIPGDAGTELADDQTVAGHLGEEINSYTFSVDESRRVTLTLTGVRDAKLSLTGAEVAETGKLCGDAQQTLEAFLDPGDYEVSVVAGRPAREEVNVDCRDNVVSVGDGYRLHMASSDLSSGERNSGPLRNGDQITGVLGASATPENSATSANRYTMTIEEPTRIDLALRSSAFDAVLDVYGDQTNLHSDDDGMGTDSRIESVLMPGEYTVEISGYAGASGSYSLQLSTTPFDGELQNNGELESGATVQGMSDSAGNVYTLKLDQPANVEVNLSSDAFDTMLYLEGNGVSLSDDDGAGDGSTNSKLTATLEPGEYQIEAASYSSGMSGGMYELSTNVMPFDGELLNSGELQVGQPVQGNLASSGYNTYEFTIDEVSMVTLDMASPAFDTYLELNGDDTSLSNDDFGNGTDSQIQAVLEPGTYEVGASSYSGTGMFSLSLAAEPFAGEIQSEGDVHIGDSIHGQLTAGGALIYQLVLDEQRTISVESQSSTVDTLLQLEGEGVRHEDDDGGSTHLGALIETTLSPGTYTITVTGYDGGSGLVQLDVRG